MEKDKNMYTAFEGERRVVAGTRLEVALALKRDGRAENVLIFDDETGRQVDFDLSGSLEAVAARLGGGQDAPAAARTPGRPKLGVVAREVTLLPRHWEWLGGQPGGASAALRRLVDAARGSDSGREGARKAQAAADRFMMAMAGDLPGYEEASRALYASDSDRFRRHIADWPDDVRGYAERLAGPAFAS
ncbi:DUF2239 family protein [Chelativorans salis]|uniref:DUF2239 family protein n=1 Tax=Chelativorans salis TaxID=2978478 RepID=A0ABT2LJS1_9HYPH|nr:DUF2239 family protein [Chelativorans sp. EGI FJ00035]MCT7374846.1 DUF2239 family protein [Chelativorans sp. EGI FJ00035]